MTVAVPAGDYSAYAGVGIEDVDASDLSIPRWKIDHNDGLFTNNQNDLAYDTLDVVLLGLVKQRVFFDPVIDENQAKDPWCKSNDNMQGYPGEGFPWEDYHFTDAAIEGEPLPCSSCNFSQWGPRDTKTGKSTPPLCNELYTFSFMNLNDEVEGIPGIITFKGTSIGPAKKYLATFVQRKQPLFLAQTRLTLTKQMFSGRKYYIVKLDNIGNTDPADWDNWANIALSARDFLQRPPNGALPPAELTAPEYTPAIEALPVAPKPAARPAPAAVSRPVAPEPEAVVPEEVSAAPEAVSEPTEPTVGHQARPRPAAVSRPAPAAPAAPAAVKPIARPAPVNTEAVVAPGDITVEGEVDDDPLPF